MMCDVRCMRTTVNLDDDVLRAAKELAALRGHTLGQTLSELIRITLGTGRNEEKLRNGVPLLPATTDPRLVTSEDVALLLEEG